MQLFPIYQRAQCSYGDCRQVYYVKVEDLARFASRVACPLCDRVTQFAEVQAQQPGISHEAKDFWGWVAQVALGVGIGMAVKQVVKWADS